MRGPGIAVVRADLGQIGDVVVIGEVDQSGCVIRLSRLVERSGRGASVQARRARRGAYGTYHVLHTIASPQLAQVSEC